MAIFDRIVSVANDGVLVSNLIHEQKMKRLLRFARNDLIENVPHSVRHKCVLVGKSSKQIKLSCCPATGGWHDSVFLGLIFAKRTTYVLQKIFRRVKKLTISANKSV